MGGFTFQECGIIAFILWRHLLLQLVVQLRMIFSLVVTLMDICDYLGKQFKTSKIY